MLESVAISLINITDKIFEMLEAHEVLEQRNTVMDAMSK